MVVVVVEDVVEVAEGVGGADVEEEKALCLLLKNWMLN
jgi:hypothetical protein